jgi:hypothetical protein
MISAITTIPKSIGATIFTRNTMIAIITISASIPTIICVKIYVFTSYIVII